MDSADRIYILPEDAVGTPRKADEIASQSQDEIILLLGPFGVGKNSIAIDIQKKDPRVIISPAYTTKGVNVIHTGSNTNEGIDIKADKAINSTRREGNFSFMKPSTFNSFNKDDLVWQYSEIDGCYYLYKIEDIITYLQYGKIPVLVFAPRGDMKMNIEKITKLTGCNVHTFLVLPPSLEVHQERLKQKYGNQADSRYQIGLEWVKNVVDQYFSDSERQRIITNSVVEDSAGSIIQCLKS